MSCVAFRFMENPALVIRFWAVRLYSRVYFQSGEASASYFFKPYGRRSTTSAFT
jgi:hypothetical protein